MNLHVCHRAEDLAGGLSVEEELEKTSEEDFYLSKIGKRKKQKLRTKMEFICSNCKV